MVFLGHRDTKAATRTTGARRITQQLSEKEKRVGSGWTGGRRLELTRNIMVTIGCQLEKI